MIEYRFESAVGIFTVTTLVDGFQLELIGADIHQSGVGQIHQSEKEAWGSLRDQKTGFVVWDSLDKVEADSQLHSNQQWKRAVVPEPRRLVSGAYPQIFSNVGSRLDSEAT